MKVVINLIFIALVLLCVSCERRSSELQDLVDRGIMHMEAGQYDEALKYYRKAIIRDPQFEGAYLQIALLYDDYLHDQTNAVRAYNEYLRVAKNEANKEKVKRWLNQVSHDAREMSDPKTTELSGEQNRVMQEELALKEKQFESIRRKLVDEHQSNIDELNQELNASKNQVAELVNENNAFRSDDKNLQTAQLLDQIAENETLLAQLETNIEVYQKEAEGALQAQQVLQTIITNLQTTSQKRTAESGTEVDWAASNAFLLSERATLLNKINILDSERKELRMDLVEFKIQQSHLTSSVPAKVVITNQPDVALTPELLQTFEDTKKEIVNLRRREKFNQQERKKLIDTINKQRNLLANKDGALKTENKRIAKLKLTADELERERASSRRRDKLLYDRTVQLKRLQQSHSSLQRQYSLEVSKRKKVTSAIADIQNEMSAPAVKAPTQPSAAYKIYSVRRGDSLSIISKKFYGDSSKWKIIFEANRSELSKASKLSIGQRLKIPTL